MFLLPLKYLKNASALVPLPEAKIARFWFVTFKLSGFWSTNIVYDEKKVILKIPDNIKILQ